MLVVEIDLAVDDEGLSTTLVVCELFESCWGPMRVCSAASGDCVNPKGIAYHMHFRPGQGRRAR